MGHPSAKNCAKVLGRKYAHIQSEYVIAAAALLGYLGVEWCSVQRKFVYCTNWRLHDSSRSYVGAQEVDDWPYIKVMCPKAKK